LEAFILVNTEAGLLWKVAEEAGSIEGVISANAVTGEFDVIIHAEYTKMSELKKIIDKLYATKGVLRTQTTVAMPMTAYDLEEETR
jgi:DNA-binding Lrp family transcriptional regulator